jgi:hypothetical protein
MSIVYNRQNNPFDEIKYIDYHNQLIVRKYNNDNIYCYNFHLDCTREEYVMNCGPGMTYLFNINSGYYHINTDGTNEFDFSITINRMSEEEINNFNSLSQTSNSPHHNQVDNNSISNNDINFSISTKP